MSRRETEAVSRHHVWLFDDDWQWLLDYYQSKMGVSRAIRVIIRNYRRNLEARAAAEAVTEDVSHD